MPKFGKPQQIAVFEDNGLPLFEQGEKVWVKSPWEPWIKAEAPKEEKPKPEQQKLF